jgi:hypothetical protein
LVRQGAWRRSREHFAWTIPVISAGLVVLIAWKLQGKQAAVDDYLTPEALGYSRRYSSQSSCTASTCFVPQPTSTLSRWSISRLEKDTTERVAALDQRITDLQALLKAQQKKQALADELTALRKVGITDLLNNPPRFIQGWLKSKPQDINKWRARDDTWQQQVLNTMRKHGATMQDIHHVEMIGTFVPARMHPDGDVSNDLCMLTVRLDRILDIIRRYAKH